VPLPKKEEGKMVPLPKKEESQLVPLPKKEESQLAPLPASQLDEMRAQAGVLRTKILKQQQELRVLEAAIEEARSRSRPSAELPEPIKTFTSTLNRTPTLTVLGRALDTFVASVNVLRRKLERVRSMRGPENRRWAGSVGRYLEAQTLTGMRIVGTLAQHPEQLRQLADPDVPSLAPHFPAILARLDRLESHVAKILERVLNNRRHLASIEPYLEGILERFDDIEPHLPWILENIDVLAPYTGLLLKHIDELILYADVDESEGIVGSKYALAEQLLPYLEEYVARLDQVGPHLPLLRPHISRFLKRGRFAKISPHVPRLFANGQLPLSISANADVLLFYLGWVFYVPLLPQLFLSLPFAPRILAWLARNLPRRFVRRCTGVECSVDWDYGANWNSLSRR